MKTASILVLLALLTGCGNLQFCSTNHGHSLRDRLDSIDRSSHTARTLADSREWQFPKNAWPGLENTRADHPWDALVNRTMGPELQLGGPVPMSKQFAVVLEGGGTAADRWRRGAR